MNLDKSDLQQIEKIVDKRAQVTERRFEKKIDSTVGKEITGAKEELKDFIGKEIESLAGMAKRSFDSVDNRFDKLDKGQQQIRKDISNLEFIATEMVRRDEFIELKQRLTKIEAKLGLVK